MPSLAESLMPEGDPFAGMSPVDALKLRQELAAKYPVSPEQRSANLRTTGMDALSVTPVIGNLMSAGDAYTGVKDAANAFSQGNVKQGALASALAALSGLGAVTGWPVGTTARNVAKGGSHTLFSGAGPVTKPTETPEFANWFGASKVTDSGGQPLRVYHGTASDVESFAPQLSGTKSKTGAPEGTFFFTDKPDVASSYTVKWQGDFGSELHPGANVIPAHLSMKKPLKVNAKGENWREIFYKGEYRDINEIAQMAKDSGRYDGLIVNRVIDKGVGDVQSKNATTYVAFRPEQIKSAIGNRGTFDPNDPRINYAVAGGLGASMAYPSLMADDRNRQ